MTFTDITIRNHAFDKTMYPNECVLTVLLNVNDEVYDYLKNLDRKQYVLEKNNIVFIEQYREKWLSKQSLDFYLPEYNIAIECQGMQHFKNERGIPRP